MPIKFFIGTIPRHLHERKMILEAAQLLEGEYRNYSQFCALFIHYQCGKKEIDATLFRDDAIINIEFKGHKARVVKATGQGDLLLSMGSEHDGGFKPISESQNGETALSRMKEQSYALTEVVSKLPESVRRGVGLSNSSSRLDTCGFYVFADYEHLHLVELPKEVTGYFRIAKVSNMVESLRKYRGRDPRNPKEPGSHLGLNQEFIETLAKSLSLTPVEQINRAFSQAEGRLSGLARQRLEKNVSVWQVAQYVSRKDLEERVQSVRRMIITGPPGSGKTSLLMETLRQHAMKMLHDESDSELPVLLNLASNEDIQEALAGHLGLPLDDTQRLLESGELWIVFDGVDEIARIKENLPRITSFIRLYPENRYSLSVRRDMFQNTDLQGLWQPISDFTEIQVGPFTSTERKELLHSKMGLDLPDGIISEAEFFVNNIPDATPLSTKMAIEIISHSDKPAYENIGRFYRAYFRVRLKREIALSKDFRRGTDQLLKDILVRVAGEILVSNERWIALPRLLRLVKEVTGDEPTVYLDSLLRAEILFLEEAPESGSRVVGETSARFFHATYLEYFVAEYLSESDNSSNWLERPKDNSVITPNALAMYCGLANNLEAIDKLIADPNLGTAVVCFCNTDHVSPKIATDLSSWLCRIADGDKYGALAVIDYIKKYGARICGANLFSKFESLPLHNSILRIEWEFVKHHYLRLGDIPSDLVSTPRYQYLLGSPARGEVRFDGVRESFSGLAHCDLVQNRTGYDYYIQLLTVKTIDEFLELLFDDSYDPVARSCSFTDLFNLCREGTVTKASMCHFIMERVAKPDIYPFLFKWDLIPFFCFTFNTEQEEYPQLIKSDEYAYLFRWFIDEDNGLIHLRILFGCEGIGIEDRTRLLEWIFTSYSNDRKVDLTTLFRTWSEEFYEELDVYLENDPAPIAGDYCLKDFADDSYTVLIKCIALEKYFSTGAKNSYEVFLKHAHHADEKIRRIAESLLDKLLASEE